MLDNDGKAGFDTKRDHSLQVTIKLKSAQDKIQTTMSRVEEVRAGEQRRGLESSDVAVTAKERLRRIFEENMKIVARRRLQEDIKRENERCREDREMWEQIVESERRQSTSYTSSIGAFCEESHDQDQLIARKIKLETSEGAFVGSEYPATIQSIVKDKRRGNKRAAHIAADEALARSLGTLKPATRSSGGGKSNARSTSTGSTRLQKPAAAKKPAVTSSSVKLFPGLCKDPGNRSSSSSLSDPPSSDEEPSNTLQGNDSGGQTQDSITVSGGGHKELSKHIDTPEEKRLFLPNTLSSTIKEERSTDSPPNGRTIRTVKENKSGEAQPSKGMGKITKERFGWKEGTRPSAIAVSTGVPNPIPTQSSAKPAEPSSPPPTSKASITSQFRSEKTGPTASSQSTSKKKRRPETLPTSERKPKRQKKHPPTCFEGESDSSEDSNSPIRIRPHPMLTPMQKRELDQKEDERRREEARRMGTGLVSLLAAKGWGK